MGLDTFNLEIESVVGSETGAPEEKITYRVNRYSLDDFEERLKKQIKWAVKVDGVVKPAGNALSGDVVEIILKKEWEGKEILVMAQNFFRDFKESAGQKTKVTRFPQTLVKEISGETEASGGQTIQYRVKSYNRQENNISKDIQDRVKWAVKVDGKIEELKDKKGGRINLEIKKEWDGKEIMVMACLQSFREDVCKKTKIKGYYYKGTKKWGALQTGFPASGHNYSLDEILQLPKMDERGKQNAKLLNKMSKEVVKGVYETTLKAILSDDDNIRKRVINNFYTGRGNSLTFYEDSTQSKKLHTYEPFLNYYNNYLEVLKIMLKEKSLEIKDGEAIAKYFTKINAHYTPNFSQDMFSHDYFGLMGGTQSIGVELEIKQINDTSSYEVKTKMRIGDWYGADYNDINGGNLSGNFDFENVSLYTSVWELGKRVVKGAVKTVVEIKENWKGNTPSLPSFFWLQHHYGCCPFKTEIIFVKTDMINL
jgi:hypothetical protein